MKTTKTFSKTPLAFAIGGAIAGATSMAAAQEAESTAGQLEEIIVTATSRETTVHDIPYNISALSGDAIELFNMVDQYDVLRAMHGVTDR